MICLQMRKGKRKKMGPFDYVVVKLYGDYADLKRTDIESDELLMIARALLPDEVEEGRWWELSEIDENIGKGVFTPNFESEFQMIRSSLLALL